MGRQLIVIALALLATSGMALARDREDRKDTKQGWLGLYLGKPAGQLTEDADVDADNALMILKVMEESPAADAGLEAHDIIVAFNGEDFENLEGFVDLVRDTAPGQEVIVEIIRDGARQSRTAVLGTRPEDMGKFKVKSFKIGKDGDFDFDFDFNFDVDEHFPHGKKMYLFHGAHGSGVGQRLKEMIGDEQGGNMKVEVTCEDGEGTITVERDGEVTTETFDCTDMEDHAVISKKIWKQAPHIEIPDIDMDIELPHLQGLRDRIEVLRLDQEPTTKFRSMPDGTVVVTIRQGDAELSEEYSSAEELAYKNPKLYKKYNALKEALNE